MKKNYLFIFVFLFSNLLLSAQNEFYISGDNNSATTEVFVSGSDGVNPTLFVQGEIVNNQGIFINNDGVIELTGDFSNTANGSDGYYESTGVERFSGNSNSTVSGDLQGTTGNRNQFYSLKINKDVASNFVSLSDNVHVNPNGTLDFEGNGVLRTDISSYGKNGDSYNNYLLLRNSNSNAILNASITPGTSNNYIEGKLRWITNGTNEYAFPVGGSEDGVEPFGLSLTDASNLTIEGHILPQSAINSLTEGGRVYLDVGETPDPNSSVADGCIGGADGVLDKIELIEHSGIGWNASAIDGAFSSYDIVFAAAPSNDITPFNPVINSCEDIELLYVSKNGVPSGEENVISGTQVWPGLSGNQVAPQTESTIAVISGFHLSNMTSFSSFGLHTTSASNVLLPVELIFLTAYGVDNEYIQVDWTTATEINNDGFEIQRSENGVDFNTIGWVEGMGNGTNINNYSLEDFEVNKDIVYYYRLKQIDFDGAFEFSNIVSASLKSDGLFDVRVYPNPNRRGENLNIDIYSDASLEASLNIYDMLGKVVYFDKLLLEKGKNTYQLKNSGVASGQYFVAIQTQENYQTKNIIVTD